MVKSVVRSALENHNTVNKNSNEVYFVSKQACAKRARERERERDREGQACQEFQEFHSTRCTSSPSKFVQSERERERGGEKERQA